jgi:pyridoxal phosphate enzyme (YggS family)
MDGQLKSCLADRLAMIEERIGAACRRAGRQRSELTLVAVTKTVDAALAALLPELGVLDLGESRPQELWRKAAMVPGPVRWHLVGHLQRNKIERTLPLVHVIHSVDSLRLLQALDQEAAKQQQRVQALLEVNASGEPAKHGFGPTEITGVAPKIDQLRHIQVMGLMTMAALEDAQERSRPTFALLRQLRDQLKGSLTRPHRLEHLSMGMSNDFEVAIEEGATFIRLGTVIFEGLSETKR